MSKTHHCPHCGQRIAININAVGSYSKPRLRPGTMILESTRPSPFRNEAPAIPMPPGYEIRNESASFLPTTEAHVKVPLLRSLITGGYAGIAGGVIVAYLNMYSVWGRVSGWGSVGYGVMWGGLFFFGTSFIYWLSITGKYDNLLSRIETYTGVDIDQDGEVGTPEPPTIRVEVKEGGNWRFANLPGDNETLQRFASDILNNIRTFSEQGANENGYGTDNFKKLRGIFLEKGWAAWNHPSRRQQGVSLTRSGQWVLKEIASTPLPYRDSGVQNEGGDARGSRLYERFKHI